MGSRDTVSDVDLSEFNRRTFLLGGVSLGILTACGGNDSTALVPSRLGVRFPDGFRAPSVAVTGHGPQRFPFVVIADDGLPMITDSPASIDIDVLFGGESVTRQTVAARGLGQFTPYYPLEFTPATTGNYVARTEFSDIDVEFLVVDRSETALYQVGEPLPPFDTPTFEDARGVSPICTRTEPCPFHTLTLTQALDNDLPTALIISTPGFCQTDVCGPSLEFVIEAASGRDTINVVHAEVYENFVDDTSNGRSPTLSPLITAWNLEFEPSLFVADASGTIVGALHFAFDRDETVEMFDLIS